MLATSFLAAALLLPSLAVAQLSGSVGPLTTFKTKAAKKVCNVLDYGAKADSSTDIGPAITSAWAACKTGGLIYIPSGTYAMKTWVDLSGGSATAIQLDGTIFRAGTDGGNMIGIKNSNDVEFFSGNSKGALQGYGYEFISKGTFGPRFMRFTNVNNFSLHGIALIDSASYYVVFDTCTNGEIYNLILRGISIGETDGIDIWGTNIWVHDVEVTNGDECVTVKSPAHNILIESIYCNLSGGTAIGSLGLETDISNVYYRRLYMNQADPCYLKTNGGNGTVTGVTWDTVIVHKGPYVLAVNEAWGTDRGGKGVQVSNLTYKNWWGYNSDNSRPTIRLECDPDVPCYDISLTNVNLWTASGDNVKWSCQNAYGSGACLRAPGSKLTTYTSATTVSSKPNYAASSMAADLASAFPSTASFTIPALPTSFYPGAKPSSALLNLNGAGGLRRRTAAPAPTQAAVL